MRHGFGYSRCRHLGHGIEHETTLFVPREDCVRICLVRLTNSGEAPRRVSLFSYYRLDPGPASRRSISTTIDPHGTVLARRRPDDDYPDSVTFAAVAAPAKTAVHATCDRRGFLGGNGRTASPAALCRAESLDGASGTGPDVCIAQQTELRLAPGATIEVAFLFGEEDGEREARATAERYLRPGAIDAAFEQATAFWKRTHSAVRIETPSSALDLLANGWLAYQTLACRIWGRSALYQSGGAFGFRDQLQDSSALILLRPDIAREQILRNASHQFREGDVLHWWHPPRSCGIRTRFVDDLLWLPYLTAFYVRSTGDWSVLDEPLPFLTGRELAPGEDEAFLTPERAGESADLYEHCVRALDRSLGTGGHGLPRFGTGDWNDGMNRVGRLGRGESVWMGFFLYRVLGDFLPGCERRGDQPRRDRYREHRDELRSALEESGWDGEWYRRGYYDDGTPLGSRHSTECRIDALVQAWSVLSKGAEPDRADRAMGAVEREIVSREDGLIRLLTPPFDETPLDPGYIKGYVPGVRENGGQYTHAALWVVRAMAELGRNDRVAELLELLNPVHHASTPEQVELYQVEPYVVAADVYGAPPHVGRGGWTWYTGSSGWMYRVILESLLGFRIVGGDTVELAPCVPDTWPEFGVRYRPDDATRWEFRITNPTGQAREVVAVTIDGEPVVVEGGIGRIPLIRDGRQHRADLVLGTSESGRS
jgi:cyclic beta-1,2-glucan synthetase